MDFTFGITLKFERKKKPFAIGQVFYDKGNHLIEFHDPENTNNMIKGLIPPLPEGMQTPTEEKPQDKKGSGGIA
jgi:hypothetical protein